MLIGVLSDTHNDFASIDRAIKFFNLRNVDLVLHCGDIFSVNAAKEFTKLNCGFKAVFGNNDIEQAELETTISNFGMINAAPFEFKVSGKMFIMMHRPVNLEVLAKSGKYDYILYGHLHKPAVEKIEKTTVLSPGEACGLRYGVKTVALIDLISGESEIYDLDF